ncbi:MAG: hypothetical protein ACR2QF_09295 [Geminicoccaceae bacterium]
MAARMYIWPRYALEVDGKRFRLPDRVGAAVARLFQARGYVDREELIEAVYYDDPNGGPLWAEGCLQQFLYRVNVMLVSTTAHIECAYGRGYRLHLP